MLTKSRSWQLKISWSRWVSVSTIFSLILSISLGLDKTTFKKSAFQSQPRDHGNKIFGHGLEVEILVSLISVLSMHYATLFTPTKFYWEMNEANISACSAMARVHLFGHGPAFRRLSSGHPLVVFLLSSLLF